MRAKILMLSILICGWGRLCFAVTLHIGDAQITLSETRHTSPTLVVRIGDARYYGALFSDDAPTGTVRTNIEGTQYWLGEWCAPGTYLPAGASRCADCGLGHYCTGNRHRAACSGGIIGCPGTRATADAAAPAFANRILTADEIAENITPTDLSQWRQISCCKSLYDDYYNTLDKDLSKVNSVQGCAGGPLDTGTYLFTVRTGDWCPASDPFSGVGSFSTDIMVFDHTVSYKTIHAKNIFYNFLDLDGPEFTGYDVRVPDHYYCATDIRANVDGLADVPRAICVYELR